MCETMYVLQVWSDRYLDQLELSNLILTTFLQHFVLFDNTFCAIHWCIILCISVIHGKSQDLEMPFHPWPSFPHRRWQINGCPRSHHPNKDHQNNPLKSDRLSRCRLTLISRFAKVSIPSQCPKPVNLQWGRVGYPRSSRWKKALKIPRLFTKILNLCNTGRNLQIATDFRMVATSWQTLVTNKWFVIITRLIFIATARWCRI